jgi:hypothetical protein
MNTLLQLNSSIFSAAGQSTRLADEYVALWRTATSKRAGHRARFRTRSGAAPKRRGISVFHRRSGAAQRCAARGGRHTRTR